MYFHDALVSFSALFLLPSLVFAACPLPVEPHLPIPSLSEADFSSVISNVTAELDAALAATASSDPAYANVSVSIVVTGADDTPWFTYNFGPEGSNITVDSVYRIASISKVFAVYEALVNHLDLDNTLAQWIPEFGREGVNQITLRSLAAQTSGMSRDYPDNDLSVTPIDSIFDEITDRIVTLLRQLVPLPDSEKPPCLTVGLARDYGGRGCTVEDYINAISMRDLVYPPSSFPSYSNLAYDFLGHAVSLKTNRSFSDLILDDVARRLTMPHTSVLKPDDSLGVIPTVQANATWYNDFGWASPSGAMYSSAADLAQFARLILRDFNSFTNTSLGLPGYVLREWLKPHSYTASNTHFVGLPWEDLRPTFTRLNGGFPFTIHAKSGSLLFYVSSLSIIPEYGMGLAVLASGGTGLESTVLADIIVQRFAAAVEAHRVQYARDTYAGVYNGTSGNISSVYELRVPDDGLGLEIVRWEAAGYDLLSGVLGGQVPNNTGAPVLRLQRKVRRQENNSTTTVSFRLFPTQVETPDTWRYAPYTQALPTTESVFAGLCGEWFGTDSGYYGGQPLDMIRFVRDEGGRVTGVEIPWLRLQLTKQT